VEKTMEASVPGDAVASKLTWRPLAIVAVADDAPACVPSVSLADDRPALSVNYDGPTVPLIAVHFTVASPAGFPASSVTRTTSGALSWVETRAV